MTKSRRAMNTGFIGLAGMSFALIASPGSGQEQIAQGSAGWSFTVAPYFWAAGMDGEIGARDRQADVDVSFSVVRENLNFGVMMLAEARNDPRRFLRASLRSPGG